MYKEWQIKNMHIVIDRSITDVVSQSLQVVESLKRTRADGGQWSLLD